MANDALEAFGSILGLIGFLISIVVMAGLLVEIGAPVWLWVMYIVELLFLFIGTILQAIGKAL